MLFHVTMTHTPDNCPGYHPEMMPDLVAALEKWEAVAKELNIKIHFSVNGAPEHVSYALVEADSPGVLIPFLHLVPIRQDFRITPVQHQRDMLAQAKAMAQS